MRSARLYVEQALEAGATVTLPERAAHHALRVLRLRPGDPVTLFDGRGGEWPSTLGERGRVALGERRDVERESPLAVTLVQAVSGGERMDYTVQKAVELGVAALAPVVSAKSVVRLEGARAEARRMHWQRVAIAACEQCGRNRVPVVRPIVALERYAREADDPRPRVLLSAHADAGLRALAPRGQLTLAAGPEAGFGQEEEALLERAGFVRARLGPRVLRTETAALAALAALNALAGDF